METDDRPKGHAEGDPDEIRPNARDGEAVIPAVGPEQFGFAPGIGLAGFPVADEDNLNGDDEERNDE
jgi:hypothetical protein